MRCKRVPREHEEGSQGEGDEGTVQALTAGTGRACIHDFRFLGHSLDDQFVSTPPVYFSHFNCFALEANSVR